MFPHISKRDQNNSFLPEKPRILLRLLTESHSPSISSISTKRNVVQDENSQCPNYICVHDAYSTHINFYTNACKVAYLTPFPLSCTFFGGKKSKNNVPDLSKKVDIWASFDTHYVYGDVCAYITGYIKWIIMYLRNILFCRGTQGKK